MAKNMPENQNGEEEVKEVRISREELKQARREAKAAKKVASEKQKGYVAERKSGIAINAYRLRRRACLFGNFDCYGLRSWQIA